MDLVRGLEVTLIGMLVVFATLVLLQGVIILIGLSSRLLNRDSKQDKPAAKPAAPKPAENAIPPEHLAAIAAAVAMMGQVYRIRTIEAVCPENWERSRYTDIKSF